jgi:hypothetical protein
LRERGYLVGDPPADAPKECGEPPVYLVIDGAVAAGLEWAGDGRLTVSDLVAVP